MGNGIFGRMAANRQARIQNRNNYCQGGRVYYCRQPVVHCQPTAQHYPQQQSIYQQAQPLIRHSPVIQSQVQTNVLEQAIPKPPKLDLDFSLLKNNTIDQNTKLGQWLKDKRQKSEINMFQIGDVHIMEVHGDSPKLQFFDKAGNKWQSLSQEQALEFYQSKQKFQSKETTNKKTEENKMAGVIGNSPKQSTGLVNGNTAGASSGAGSSSGAESGSDSKSGSTAIAGTGVTVNNNVGDRYSPSSGNGGMTITRTRTPDGTVTEEVKISGNGPGSIIVGDDFTAFGTSQETDGNSVATGGNIGDNNAVGHNASNNGLSQKDKKLLTSLLNRNNESTDGAKLEILDALNKAKTTIQEGVKGAKSSADQASGASAQAAEQSKATQETVSEALAEFKKLSFENRKIVQDAIDGFVKEIKGLIEADRVTDNEAIQGILKQRVKQFNELKQSLKGIVPQIAKYMDSQTESISADLNRILDGQKAAPAAQDAKQPQVDAKKDDAQVKPADNQTSQVLAWSNYALVA